MSGSRVHRVALGILSSFSILLNVVWLCRFVGLAIAGWMPYDTPLLCI